MIYLLKKEFNPSFDLCDPDEVEEKNHKKNILVENNFIFMWSIYSVRKASSVFANTMCRFLSLFF